MSDYYCLNNMKPEQTAKVLSLTCTGAARRRLRDLGLVDRKSVV